MLELNKAKIYYEVEGAGHPLLLIHGGLGSLRMWDGNAPAFARRYLVIRYDTRGFGRTETEDVEFTNADDAVALLDHLGADPPTSSVSRAEAASRSTWRSIVPTASTR